MDKWPTITDLIDAAVASGMTISQIAEAIGVSRDTLYKWREGRSPSVESYAALCEVAGVEPRWPKR